MWCRMLCCDGQDVRTLTPLDAVRENWDVFPAHEGHSTTGGHAPTCLSLGGQHLGTDAGDSGTSACLVCLLFARKADYVAIIILATAQRAWNFNNHPVQ